ncbi:hypothetical protein AQ765_27165 [Burkholderia pseudomallei]|nr:hypothetical protein X989_4970 [Burkholderia pseudomallei MSHR4378]KGS23577.1 hypothetical protein X962_5034 [Burkholderia pseudomallei MSHR7343]KGS40827.1 hypothetical protein X945_4271 [Burkholderia pseudomallei ABCPW 107]KGS81651.1 hypothetical protein X947_3817 [Burkholderia pseudomallei MSHR7334]KGS93279.1 hypothetical protein X963_4661 [Burkholderia pseudomallei MSHR7498]KGW36444.1 hypothetical protein Y047_5555 [Burkholderia pseudomallei MSHR3016]KGX56573.1 hypothetical protein Y027
MPVEGWLHEQCANKWRVGHYGQTNTCRLAPAFTDPPTSLTDLLYQKIAIKQMDLVRVNPILFHGETDVVKRPDVGHTHRAVF